MFKNWKTSLAGILAGVAQLAVAASTAQGKLGLYAGAVGAVATALVGVFAHDASKVVK